MRNGSIGNRRRRPGFLTGHPISAPQPREPPTVSQTYDKSWLDAGGTPHTEALKTTERLRRIDFGHMEIEFTFDDPKTFTRPWSTTVKFNLLADTDLLEFHCDNEKWAERPRP
jgi:hypothetical protein